MSLPNCPKRDVLAGYVLGTLSEEEAESVAEHVETCARCDVTLEELETHGDAVMQNLRLPPVNVPELASPECRDALARAEAAGISAAAPSKGGTAQQEKNEQPMRLGEYELVAKLGEGGMGAVYKARHTKLKRIVALKVLPKERVSDKRAIARFEREMEAVGQLDHPNIVRAYDAREIDGTHFLVMEYVDGRDFSALVEHVGPLRVTDACEVIRQAALGLQYAHEHGLVHRDIKPSNLMLTAAGQVKILDLGLALLSSGEPDRGELTSSGQPMGTADYIAPEQTTDSHSVDIRADIYSLGCTLFKLLSGRAPFTEAKYKTAFHKMMAHMTEPIPLPRLKAARQDVSDPLLAVLQRMVAKQPVERFGTPAEVVAALAHFASGANLQRLHIETTPGHPRAQTNMPHTVTLQHLSSASADTDERGEAAAPVAGSGPPAPTPPAAPKAAPVPTAPKTARVAPAPKAAPAAPAPKAVPAAPAPKTAPAAPAPKTAPAAAAKKEIAKPKTSSRRFIPWVAAGVLLAVGGAGLYYGTTILLKNRRGEQVGKIELPEGITPEIVPAEKAVNNPLKPSTLPPPPAATAAASGGQPTATGRQQTPAAKKPSLGPDTALAKAATIGQPKPGSGKKGMGGGQRPGGNKQQGPPLAKSSMPPPEAARVQKQWATFLKAPVELSNSLQMPLVLIPPGEFQMGATPKELTGEISPADEDKPAHPSGERLPGEQPRHRVKISRPFRLSKFPVTQKEFQFVIGWNPSAFAPTGSRKDAVRKVDTGRYPAEMVTWEDAAEFCRQLTALPDETAAGRVYRLPTEAEWEYACRAGVAGRWNCGDDPAGLADVAWFKQNAGGAPHPVGQKKPNAWGLCDMHGNVWQWCADWFAADYYQQSPEKDPRGPAEGHSRVSRGGAFSSTAGECRSSSRSGMAAASRPEGRGFRVVLEIGKAPLRQEAAR